MKNLFSLLLVFLICSGCFKSNEETRGETLGKEIAGRMKAPIEKTRLIADKIGELRDVELEE